MHGPQRGRPHEAGSGRNGSTSARSASNKSVSYFAFYDLWEAVGKRCKAQGYRLTVYIDDVTISGSQVPAEFMWEIRQAIHGAGLRYHKEKRYVDRPAEITGVIVDGDRLVAPHRQFKKLHAGRREFAITRDPAVALKLGGMISGMIGQLAQIRNMNDKLATEPAPTQP